MSEQAEKLGALTAFMAALTPRGVALLCVLGGAGALGYAVWEQRQILLPAYLGSTAALVGTGVAVTLILLALLTMDIFGRLEARAQEALRTHAASVQAHAEALQAQINMQAATNATTLAELVALRGEHANCQKQVAEMGLMIARLNMRGDSV